MSNKAKQIKAKLRNSRRAPVAVGVLKKQSTVNNKQKLVDYYNAKKVKEIETRNEWIDAPLPNRTSTEKHKSDIRGYEAKKPMTSLGLNRQNELKEDLAVHTLAQNDSINLRITFISPSKKLESPKGKKDSKLVQG